MGIASQQPSLLRVSDELPSLLAASRIDIHEVEADMRRLKNELTKASATTAATVKKSQDEQAPAAREGGDEEADLFPRIAPGIISTAEERMTEVGKSIESAKEVFNQTRSFFSETRKDVTCHSFLGYIKGFLVEFHAAAEAHRAREETAAKRKAARKAGNLRNRLQLNKKAHHHHNRKGHKECDSPAKKTRSTRSPRPGGLRRQRQRTSGGDAEEEVSGDNPEEEAECQTEQEGESSSAGPPFFPPAGPTDAAAAAANG